MKTKCQYKWGRQKILKECQEPIKSLDMGSAISDIMNGASILARNAALSTNSRRRRVRHEWNMKWHWTLWLKWWNNTTKESDTSSFKKLIRTVAEAIDAMIDAVVADASKWSENDLLVAEGHGQLKCDFPGC